MISNNNNRVQYKYIQTRLCTRFDLWKVFDHFVEVNLSDNVIFNTRQC